MHCRTVLITLCTAISVAAGASGAFAQDAPVPTQRPADIRLGSCATLGEVVVPLSPLAAPSGESQGQPGATPAEQSVTALPLGLAEMLATGHAVTVSTAPEDGGAMVACGEIGGAVGADGALAIGLGGMNGAKVSGTAYFAPSPEGGSTVTLLLIDQRAGRRGADAGEATTEPVTGDAASSAPAAVDTAAGEDGTAPPPAAAPAPATAGLDGVSTISASDADGKNAKPARNRDKAKADRDDNGNGGTVTTSTDEVNDDAKDGKRGREGGARAGEDG